MKLRRVLAESLKCVFVMAGEERNEADKDKSFSDGLDTENSRNEVNKVMKCQDDTLSNPS